MSKKDDAVVGKKRKECPPRGDRGARRGCWPRWSVPLTTNFVVVSHRNHLSAMSGPIVFTNQVMTCDFMTNWTCYYGGTNGCVELEPGVWGMIAGDADGDGKITDTDRAIIQQQAGKTGYLPGDLNLDGVVDAN